MTARDEVVQLLADLPNLPEAIRVKPYAGSLENLIGTVVMVRVDKVRRGTTGGLRAYDMALILVTGQTEPGPADDALDGALEDVLHALETGDLPDGVLIGDAERAVFADGTYPCYQINLTALGKKETTP